METETCTSLRRSQYDWGHHIIRHRSASSDVTREQKAFWRPSTSLIHRRFLPVFTGGSDEPLDWYGRNDLGSKQTETGGLRSKTPTRTSPLSTGQKRRRPARTSRGEWMWDIESILETLETRRADRSRFFAAKGTSSNR